MKTVIYARVSSLAKTSIAQQVDSCESYIGSQDLPEVAGIYSDEAISGKLPVSQRPAGSRCLKALKYGDHLVTTKPDRLGRNFPDLISVLDSLDTRGIYVHFVKFGEMSGLSGNSTMGKLIFRILAMVADMEREFAVDRKLESNVYRRERGLPTSRPEYGTCHVEIDGKLSVQEDPKERAVIDMVLVLFNTGHTNRQIADILNKRGLRTRHGTTFKPRRVRLLHMTHSGSYTLQEARVAVYGMNTAVGEEGRKWRTAQQKKKAAEAAEYIEGLTTTPSGLDDDEPQNVEGG